MDKGNKSVRLMPGAVVVVGNGRGGRSGGDYGGGGHAAAREEGLVGTDDQLRQQPVGERVKVVAVKL